MDRNLNPPGLDLLHGLVLENGRRWGEVATGWQRDDATALLDASGRRYHYLTRPRGGSKTTDVAGVCLAWLVEQAPPSGRGFVVASDEDQASELIDAARGLVARTPGMAGAVEVLADRLRLAASDSTVRVLPADGAGNFGKRPLLTIIDEAAQIPETRAAQRNWTAVTSGVVKGRGLGRLVVMTTAGDPAHRAYRLLEHARRSDQWRVSEVPGPLPWMDAEDLAEQRSLLTEWDFERLHLNRWTAADDRLVSLEGLRACVTLDEWPVPARRGVRYSMGLDLGLKSDRTVLAVVHAEPLPGGPPRVVLDRMHVLQGSRSRPVELASVEALVAEAWAGYGRPRVTTDPWQAVGLAQRLRGRGVAVDEFAFSSSSVGRLARVLHVLLRDQRVALPDDEQLLEELSNVRLVETGPGLLRLNHDPGRHDDRAIALALAALPVVQAGAERALRLVPGGRFFTVPRGVHDRAGRGGPSQRMTGIGYPQIGGRR